MESLLNANIVEIDGNFIEKFTINRESEALQETVVEAAFMSEYTAKVVLLRKHFLPTLFPDATAGK